MQRDTTGAVEEIAKASRDFAAEQQRVVDLLDAKATELNDKRTEVAADIQKFSEDGRTLGQRVDEGEKRLKDNATSQMQIVAGEFAKFQQHFTAAILALRIC